MRETTVDINPYCMKLTIVQTDDFAEFIAKYAPKEKLKKVIGRVGFVHDVEDHLFAVFCSKARPDDVVHECVHLVSHVFKWTHAKPDVKNDETQAYLTGWFFKTIEGFLMKSK